MFINVKILKNPLKFSKKFIENGKRASSTNKDSSLNMDFVCFIFMNY